MSTKAASGNGVLLQWGDVLPWFDAPTLGGIPRFEFDTIAGRYVVLLFVASAGQEASQAALRVVQEQRDLFDDRHAMFFGVTRDPEDREQRRIAQAVPGIRWFLDFRGVVSAHLGAMGAD